jgi:hypothetical protein
VIELLLLFDTIDGDNSIFIESDGVGVWCFCVGGYITISLLMEFELVVVEYDWSLILLQAIDCVDGCVVRILSFCETVDVLRWWRWIWCCINGIGVDEIGLSTGVLVVVNAVILTKISFFIIVGDEHGLTDGVLLADIVLLLKIEKIKI